MAFPPINPALDRALAAQGYAEPTPVQSAVLEAEAADRDLLVSAQTGSGKTVAFGLALAPTLLGGAEAFAEAAAPLALIIAPTRELAIQVARELTWLYGQTGAVIATCVGGMDPRREQRALAAGAHMVVGTPGRLRDHLERGNLDLSALDALVLDEADEMLDLGFREDLEFILDAAPPQRRTLLFSATIAREIAALARRYQRDALRIDTTVRNQPHGDIEYRALRIAPNDVEHAVVNVLRYYEPPGALVFCATREAVRHLHAALRERGFSAVGLSGEMGQRERNEALQALRDGHARVCVATDVAARGLDLPDLGLVIHADLPVNRAALLHRSGRTGRAGRKGVSILLAPHTRRRKAEMLLSSASIEAAWSAPPSADEIRAKDRERLLADPSLSEPPAEEDLALARALLELHSPEQIAAVLVRRRREGQPAPEELFDDAGAQRSRGERADRPERSERPQRLAPDEVAWFRLPIGRSKNADPKWLIPLICRQGHVTKGDIGQIRIFANETKFEIANRVQERFLAAIAGPAEEGLRITPAGAPGPKEARSAAPRSGEDAPRRPFKPKRDGGGPPGPPRGAKKSKRRG
ncbi:MAG: DEAD/DEAH box helicase [Phenylobacterium sp.]|uniref:DEAD/DEAH box helicase n=1 Tax=Phenylobacterium sp. TaxID=1871053 RepID=UPI00391965AD